MTTSMQRNQPDEHMAEPLTLSELLRFRAELTPEAPLFRCGDERRTAREMEIVGMTLDRHSTKDISFLLQISHGTCKVHLNNIFRKLSVSSRQELMLLASGQV